MTTEDVISMIAVAACLAALAACILAHYLAALGRSLEGPGPTNFGENPY